MRARSLQGLSSRSLVRACLTPIDRSDGADAIYTRHVGKCVHTPVGTFRGTNPNVPTRGSAEARRDRLIADTTEYGPATVHLAGDRQVAGAVKGRLFKDHVDGLGQPAKIAPGGVEVTIRLAENTFAIGDEKGVDARKGA